MQCIFRTKAVYMALLATCVFSAPGHAAITNIDNAVRNITADDHCTATFTDSLRGDADTYHVVMIDNHGYKKDMNTTTRFDLSSNDDFVLTAKKICATVNGCSQVTVAYSKSSGSGHCDSSAYTKYDCALPLPLGATYTDGTLCTMVDIVYGCLWADLQSGYHYVDAKCTQEPDAVVVDGGDVSDLDGGGLGAD
jgi:hypothetical protein